MTIETPKVPPDGPDIEDKESGASADRKSLYKSIARSVEAEIKQVTDASLGTWRAEILNIEFDPDGLLVSVLLPFPILEPSADEDDWPRSRQEQEHLRTKYAEYLFREKNEAKLASVFYQKLVAFIIEYRTFDRFGPDVIKRLNTIVQRGLAGHPTETIRPALGRAIQREGRAVSRTIESMRDYVQLLQRTHRKLQDATILRRLRRKFPQRRCPWLEHFYALGGKIPRRRYWSAVPDEVVVPENASSDGKRAPCTISEPNHWSIPDITARVVQARCHKDMGKTFPLLKIKSLIRKRRRSTSSIAAK